MGHQRHITIDAEKYKWCMEGAISPIYGARKVAYIPFMVHGWCHISHLWCMDGAPLLGHLWCMKGQ